MPGEGKSDMDRIGLFSEMGYTTIGDKYVPNYDRPFNETAGKKRQLFPGGSKMKSALQAGYFDSEFKRIFDREAYSDPVKLRRQFRMVESKKNVGKPFLPSSGDKLLSGLGSYYGSFSGPVPAFSAESKPKEVYVAPGKNLYTNPPKHGTGYGYTGLTIGKSFSYSTDNYDTSKETSKAANESHRQLLRGGPFKLNLYPRELFDVNPYHSDKPLPPLKRPEEKRKDIQPFRPTSPGKAPGGMKAGTFDLYPAHSNDPYPTKFTKSDITEKGGRLFHPPPGPKSRPTQSIIAAHVMKSVNPVNYKTVNLASY